jgi:hypothetical protein
LHGNILCIFFVFVGIFFVACELQMREVQLIICDDVRALGSVTLPLDGVV